MILARTKLPRLLCAIATLAVLLSCSSSTEPAQTKPEFEGLVVGLVLNRSVVGTGGVVTATLTLANHHGGQVELDWEGGPTFRPHASNDNLAEDSGETIFGRNPDAAVSHTLIIPAHRSASFDFHFTGARNGASEIDFIYPIPLTTGYITYKVARAVTVN